VRTQRGPRSRPGDPAVVNLSGKRAPRPRRHLYPQRCPLLSLAAGQDPHPQPGRRLAFPGRTLDNGTRACTGMRCRLSRRVPGDSPPRPSCPLQPPPEEEVAPHAAGVKAVTRFQGGDASDRRRKPGRRSWSPQRIGAAIKAADRWPQRQASDVTGCGI